MRFIDNSDRYDLKYDRLIGLFDDEDEERRPWESPRPENETTMDRWTK